MGRHDLGGATGSGRHHDRLQVQPVGGDHRRLGDRVGDILIILRNPVEDPVPVRQVRFGAAGDLVHDPDRLDRKLADRGLFREHDRVGAVIDRGRDVGHLGPGRAFGRNHRGQHLGRGDHRLGSPAGCPDQALLQHGNLGKRHLDAEVAAGNHDPAGGPVNDFLDRVGGLRLLDLGDDRDVRAELLQLVQHGVEILRLADEGNRDVVELVGDRELDPAQVVLGNRVEPGFDAGQVHALVRRERPADFYLALNRPPVVGNHAQADRAVGQIDRVLDTQGLGQFGPVDRDQGFGSRHVIGRDRHGRTVDDVHHSLRVFTDPELWPRQVPEDPDFLVEPFRDQANVLDYPYVSRLVTVRKVEPEDVYPGNDHLLEHGRIP